MLQVLVVSSVLLRRIFSRRGLAASMLVLLCLISGAQAQTPAQDLLLLSGHNRPLLSLNLMNGALPPQITFTRSSGATSALYTDAAAALFTTYTSNQPRLSTLGLLIEQSATNYLLNSGVPATQTTGSLGTGTYVFFCNGTGSVTSSLGTATATGVGAITCSLGTFQTISVTVAGTLTFTVSASVNWFDLQGQSFPTSHIVTAGATATRSVDVATAPYSYGGTGTVFAQYLPESTSATSALFSFGAGTPELRTSNNAATTAKIQSLIDGTAALATSAATFSNGSVAKVAISFGSGSFPASLNGGTIFTASNATALTLTSTMLLGADSNGDPLNGWLQQIAVYRQQSSQARLQALTH